MARAGADLRNCTTRAFWTQLPPGSQHGLLAGSKQVNHTLTPHLEFLAGVNNAYLVNVRHELALVYNDASVLENRHLAAMYGLLAGRPGADVLAALEPSRWRELRRLIINAVIHTDMVHHFPLVSKARTPSLPEGPPRTQGPGSLASSDLHASAPSMF